MSEDTNPNAVPDCTADDEMLAEYDFSQARRGNPYRHLSQSPVSIHTATGDRAVQIKTVEVVATVAPDGQVVLQLPPDVTPGTHRITVLVEVAVAE